MSTLPAASRVRSAGSEMQLLLACAGKAVGAVEDERIGMLAGEDIDWDALIDLANCHGVLPLLYQALQALAPETVPAQAMASLREHFLAATQHSLSLTAELFELLTLLGAHNIPVIPLKGPVLAGVAYGNVALRQSVDLDILIQRGDVPKAKQLLIETGYQLKEQIAASQEPAYLRAQHHYSFCRGGVLVELHYDIRERFFSFALDLDGLWERARSVQIAGREVCGLAVEDLILTLCIHGTSHCWQRLSWICDIAALLRVYPKHDWVQVLDRARALGGERMVLLGLFLAHGLLGAQLPQHAHDRIQADAWIARLADRVWDRLAHRPVEELGLLETADFSLWVRERWRDRVRYCARLMLTPTIGDWSLLALPGRLSFLYYLIRPFRLAGSYGLRPLKGAGAVQPIANPAQVAEERGR